MRRKQPIQPPTVINTTTQLKSLIQDLQHAPVIGVDTEANSLFAYHEKVCLVQLSVMDGPATGDFLVDPLAIDDMQPLGEIFANPNCEIVFHAADFDIALLKRDFDFDFVNIFDTYIAALSLGIHQRGLDRLLHEFLGINVDKSLQDSNWVQRPLTDEQIRYAQLDTHYLPALRDELMSQLVGNDLFEEALESFEAVCETPAAAAREYDPEKFWSADGVKRLRGKQLAIMHELYTWREQLAMAQDRPPFKIIRSRSLAKIAAVAPEKIEDMRKHLPKAFVEQYGEDLLEAVARGKQAKIPRRKIKRPTPASPPIINRYQALKQWRKQRAEARGVNSSVILTKQTMWALATQAPQTFAELEAVSELGPYRRAIYGDEILQILATKPTKEPS